MRNIMIVFFITVSCLSSNSQHCEWVNQFLNLEINSVKSCENRGIITLGKVDGTGIVDVDGGPGVMYLPANGPSNFYVCKFDSLGAIVWGKYMYGGDGSNFCKPYSVCLDKNGDIYIAGSFRGTFIFDPATSFSITAFANTDGFVCKLDSEGNFVWAKSVGGNDEDRIHSIVVDDSLNVYSTGTFEVNADFDPGPGVFTLTCGVNSAFVFKLNSSGVFKWAVNIKGSGTSEGNAITIYNNRYIYSTGRFTGTGDFYPGTSTFYIVGGGSEAYIWKLDLNGGFKTALSFAGDACRAYDIVVDSSGNIITCGNFIGTVDFDLGTGTHNIVTPTTSYDEDVFISKVDSLGNFLWANAIGDIGYDKPISLEMDAYSNIYTVGYVHEGTIDFDPGLGSAIANVGVGCPVRFIVKFDGNGNYIWHFFPIHNCSAVFDYPISVNDYSDIFYSGEFTGAIHDFGPLDQSYIVNGLSSGQYLSRLSQDECSNVALTFDSLLNLTCFNSGYASVNILNNLAPYELAWNTVPIITGAEANLYHPGIYTVVFTDTNNCYLERAVLIGGPDSSLIVNFNLIENLLCNSFRPGFNSTIWLDAFNDGCDTISGTLTLILDPLVSYNSATLIPDYISGDTLQWNFSSINYDSLHIIPQISVTTSASAVIGDTVCFQVMIDPIAGDADSTNNYKTYCFPVINGYDPNDKQVYPQGECPERYIEKDETITYTVRFQNTGIADAINIYILDSLDANLDLNSVRVVGNSHELITEVLPGNVLKFHFDNIYLPDSTSDEPNSHGYVIYEVNPLPTAPDGIVISNKAEIYFDFNPPVVTNSVWNTLVDTLVACNIMLSHEENTSIENDVQVYPNPTNGNVTVKTGTFIAEQIQVSDFSGRMIFSFSPQHTSVDLNLNQIEKGVYLITVTGNNKKETLRLIKQ